VAKQRSFAINIFGYQLLRFNEQISVLSKFTAKIIMIAF